MTYTKDFYVKISLMLPYPRDFEYRESAHSMGTAINRAMKKMRKELKGKKLSQANISVIKM